MGPNAVLGVVNIVSALIIIAVCIPLVQGRIKMNHWYGIRIKKSFTSEKNWYALNAYGSRQLIVWSLPLLVVGLLCFFIPIDEHGQDLLPLILGVVPIFVSLTIAIIRILVYSRKL